MPHRYFCFLHIPSLSLVNYYGKITMQNYQFRRFFYLLIFYFLILEQNEVCEGEWAYDKVTVGKCRA